MAQHEQPLEQDTLRGVHQRKTARKVKGATVGSLHNDLTRVAEQGVQDLLLEDHQPAPPLKRRPRLSRRGQGREGLARLPQDLGVLPRRVADPRSALFLRGRSVGRYFDALTIYNYHGM
jgi:hypothetical protein